MEEKKKLEDCDHFLTTPLVKNPPLTSEPVSSCQSPFSSDHHSPSFVTGKNHKKKLERKSTSFAYRIREHVRLGHKLSETVKGKLSIGAKIIKKGGRENIFREIFGVSDGEKLLNAISQPPLAPLQEFSSSPHKRLPFAVRDPLLSSGLLTRCPSRFTRSREQMRVRM